MNDQVVPQYTSQQDEGDQVVPHFMDTSAEVQYSDGRHEDDEEDEDEDEDEEDEEDDEDDEEDNEDDEEDEEDDEEDEDDEDEDDEDEDSDGGAEYDSDEEDERRAIDALVQCLIDLGQMTRMTDQAMDEPPAKKRLL